MQPTATDLPEYITSVNDMEEDNYIIQKNNTFAIPQTSQTIQSFEKFHNMEINNANHKSIEEIYNESCTNTPREVNIDLDTVVPILQSENAKSNITNNNVTTTIATDNDIQNIKELWSKDDTVIVMDCTSEDSKNAKQNIVCPSTNTSDKNNLISSEIVTKLDPNETPLFDFETVIKTAVTSDDTFCKNLLQSTYNESFTDKKMETCTTTKEALLKPVAPHNNSFSFEITASSAENDTGKPMTITINPIQIEPKNNSETKDTALTHGKK